MKRLDFAAVWVSLAQGWIDEGLAAWEKGGPCADIPLIASNVERALRLALVAVASPPPIVSRPSADIVAAGVGVERERAALELTPRACRWCGGWYAVPKGSRRSQGCYRCAPTLEDAIAEVGG